MEKNVIQLRNWKYYVELTITEWARLGRISETEPILFSLLTNSATNYSTFTAIVSGMQLQ